jgi:hypothetical protein
MTSFDDRKDSFEKKFAHDEALKFKAEARRNKMLGKWAAGLLGLEGDKAEAYVLEVIKADFAEAGDHDVYRKVAADFEAAKIDQSEHQIRRHMDEFMAEAIKQIREQG